MVDQVAQMMMLSSSSRLLALTFLAGETFKVINVPILNDATAETNETFTVDLSSPTNATLGTPTSATVTIADDDTADDDTAAGPSDVRTT